MGERGLALFDLNNKYLCWPLGIKKRKALRCAKGQKAKPVTKHVRPMNARKIIWLVLFVHTAVVLCSSNLILAVIPF